MAEDHEFDIYTEYGLQYEAAMACLASVTSRADVRAFLASVDAQFVRATQHMLPELLKRPLYHLQHYCEMVDQLRVALEDKKDGKIGGDGGSAGAGAGAMSAASASSSGNGNNAAFNKRTEQILLFQASTAMQRLRSAVSARRIAAIEARETYVESTRHTEKRVALLSSDLRARIDGWDQNLPDGSRLLYEGPLDMIGEGRRSTGRHVFVFDSYVVTCKENKQPHAYLYRLKEHYPTRVSGQPAMRVADSSPATENSCAFLVETPAGRAYTYIPSTRELKATCMAAFLHTTITRTLTAMYLQRVREFEETLGSIVPKDPKMYAFAEVDGAHNIRFERKEGADSVGGGSAALDVRGGTLIKLVERLTFPSHVDTNYLRQFMTTFRSFCSTHELLDCLVQRYTIPPPAFKDDKVMCRRFNKTYATPVRLRVVNVFKHWVDKHFYDFAADHQLQLQLLRFIRTGQSSEEVPTQKAARNLQRTFTRQLEASQKGELKGLSRVATVWDKPPPDIDWLLVDAKGPPPVVHLLTLSPKEVARQMTLIESELFRAITPPELVGQTWNKRPELAPNVVQLTARVNQVSYWARRLIVETSDLQERAEVYSLLLEVVFEFKQLNNFNGIMEITSALNSSSTKRLRHTLAEVFPKRMRKFEKINEMTADKKRMRDALATAEPPCVPYLGMYQSDITFIEDGNPDYLPLDGQAAESSLINFKKRRLVAKVIDKVQQYQNKPYNLAREDTVRRYCLDLPASTSRSSLPLPQLGATTKEKNDFEQTLFDMSLVLEPRGVEDKTDLPSAARIITDPRYHEAVRQYLSNSSGGKGTVRIKTGTTRSSAAAGNRVRASSTDGRVRSSSAAELTATFADPPLNQLSPVKTTGPSAFMPHRPVGSAEAVATSSPQAQQPQLPPLRAALPVPGSSSGAGAGVVSAAAASATPVPKPRPRPRRVANNHDNAIDTLASGGGGAGGAGGAPLPPRPPKPAHLK
eukprot:UC1_evm3s244